MCLFAYDFVVIDSLSAHNDTLADGCAAVTIKLQARLNQSVTTTKEDVTPYEEPTMPTRSFCSVIFAQLVNSNGTEWDWQELESGKIEQSLIWRASDRPLSLHFISHELQEIDEGARLTVELKSSDRKAARQICSFVYENHSWRSTEETAGVLKKQFEQPRQRRSQHQ